MRENRTYGSEGGETGPTGLPYPYPVPVLMAQIPGLVPCDLPTQPATKAP